MTPFAHLLHDIRKHHGVRQVELAARIGYEQSYISALENGSKGPPTSEFVERLIVALNLSETEQIQARDAADASQRKFIVEDGFSQDTYWMLKELRGKLAKLSDVQIRIIREVLHVHDPMSSYAEPVARQASHCREGIRM